MSNKVIIPKEYLPCLDKFVKHFGSVPNFILPSLVNNLPAQFNGCLGNGFIATQLSAPWIHVDGIYNGESVESHRAAIPSPICWMPKIISGDTTEVTDVLNVGCGLHLSIITIENVKVYCLTFISRRFPNVIFRHVKADFSTVQQSKPSTILVLPNIRIDYESPDLKIDRNFINPQLLSLSGVPWQLEGTEIVESKPQIFMVTDVVPALNESGFSLSEEANSKWFVTSLSRLSEEEANLTYEDAVAQTFKGLDSLLTEEAQAWYTLWNHGSMVLTTGSEQVSESHAENVTVDIPTYAHSELGKQARLEMENDPNLLCKMINATQYALFVSLPTKSIMAEPFEPENARNPCKFHGLSPVGLARGLTEDDYMGHVFWDQELWMLPFLTAFQPELARLCLDYRFHKMPAAITNSTLNGTTGARFPWESALTGLETSPWDLSAKNEIHVSGCISWAVQQWLLMHCSLDQENDGDFFEDLDGNCKPIQWYKTRGKILMQEIAQFWASRVSFSEAKEHYEIIDVMPPDEWVSCCANSAFTNAMAKLSLAAPKQFATWLDAEQIAATHMPDEYMIWEELSRDIYMPTDAGRSLMLEFEGFSEDTCKGIKQADTILLDYPLMYWQPPDWRRKMLDVYERLTNLDGPAMSWGMFCILSLQLGDSDRAQMHFVRQLEQNRLPFFVWTETRSGEGAINFITGAGNFLQSIMNGYAGMRTHMITLPQSESCKEDADMDILSCATIPALFLAPQELSPLPLTSLQSALNAPDHTLRLHGLKFQGRVLDVNLVYSKTTGWTTNIHLKQGLSLIVKECDLVDPKTNAYAFCKTPFSPHSTEWHLDKSSPQSIKLNVPICFYAHHTGSS
ncbi:Protein-glucosylgalactosylhydroxylysine glucosidase [Cichlidogyrus casuarinus]|uniref:Protein-glucosylgalactosylhydroxylysine glucosidase n=1 Tax=Cichlidogyrus casuarinus TaxID=1844966 RepID=A0ABD2QJP1_9PLAT